MTWRIQLIAFEIETYLITFHMVTCVCLLMEIIDYSVVNLLWYWQLIARTHIDYLYLTLSIFLTFYSLKNIFPKKEEKYRHSTKLKFIDKFIMYINILVEVEPCVLDTRKISLFIVIILSKIQNQHQIIFINATWKMFTYMFVCVCLCMLPLKHMWYFYYFFI